MPKKKVINKFWEKGATEERIDGNADRMECKELN